METSTEAVPRTGVLRARILWFGDRIQTLLRIEKEVTRAGLIGAVRESSLVLGEPRVTNQGFCPKTTIV